MESRSHSKQRLTISCTPVVLFESSLAFEEPAASDEAIASVTLKNLSIIRPPPGMFFRAIQGRSWSAVTKAGRIYSHLHIYTSRRPRLSTEARQPQLPAVPYPMRFEDWTFREDGVDGALDCVPRGGLSPVDC